MNISRAKCCKVLTDRLLLNLSFKDKCKEILHFCKVHSDLYAGAAWIYKVEGKYHMNMQTGEKWEVLDENPGDMWYVAGWQPGIRVRCYKNLHLFLGPTIATDCLGLHLGIGF